MDYTIEQLNEMMTNHINKQNENINRRLNKTTISFRHYVVIGNDFDYMVTADAENNAGVEVIANEDNAARMTLPEAKRIAQVFHAENGKGKIEWQVMEVNDFLRKLLDKNNWMLEFINKQTH